MASRWSDWHSIPVTPAEADVIISRYIPTIPTHLSGEPWRLNPWNYSHQDLVRFYWYVMSQQDTQFNASPTEWLAARGWVDSTPAAQQLGTGAGLPVTTGSGVSGTINNIVNWVKAHPLPTAGIVVGYLVLTGRRRRGLF